MLEAKFLIELAYREGFNDFGMEVSSMIHEVMKPFQYHEKDNLEDLTDEELLNTFAARYWRGLMAQSIVRNGQSVHGGDVLNMAIASWDLDKKIECFNILKDDFIDIDSEFSASDVEEVDFPEDTDEEEIFNYTVLMMSFDRLKDNNYLTATEIKKP